MRKRSGEGGQNSGQHTVIGVGRAGTICFCTALDATFSFRQLWCTSRAIPRRRAFSRLDTRRATMLARTEVPYATSAAEPEESVTWCLRETIMLFFFFFRFFAQTRHVPVWMVGMPSSLSLPCTSFAACLVRTLASAFGGIFRKEKASTASK